MIASKSLINLIIKFILHYFFRAPSGTQSCAFTEGFPIGYRTECQQKHIYRRLLALNEDGKTVTDSFQLPSCCACVVIPTTLTSRAGSPGKKENASKQQIISKTN